MLMCRRVLSTYLAFDSWSLSDNSYCYIKDVPQTYSGLTRKTMSQDLVSFKYWHISLQVVNDGCITGWRGINSTRVTRSEWTSMNNLFYPRTFKLIKYHNAESIPFYRHMQQRLLRTCMAASLWPALTQVSFAIALFPSCLSAKREQVQLHLHTVPTSLQYQQARHNNLSLWTSLRGRMVLTVCSWHQVFESRKVPWGSCVEGVWLTDSVTTETSGGTAHRQESMQNMARCSYYHDIGYGVVSLPTSSYVVLHESVNIELIIT